MPKIIKDKQIFYCGLLEFMSSRLPEALVIHHHSYGYSTIPHIEQIGTGSVWPFCHRNHVATVRMNNYIDLYDGAWFSDIEDLAAKYEKYSKSKVTIEVHEFIDKSCDISDLGE